MTVGDINVKLGLDTTAFSTGLLAAKAQALALGGSFSDIGKTLSTLGVTGGTAASNIGRALSSIATPANVAAVAIGAIGIAAVAAGAQMAKMAADYQAAMAKVGATTGMSTKELKDLQDLMYKNAAQGSRIDMKGQAAIAGGLGAAGLLGSGMSGEQQLERIKLVEHAMTALEAPSENIVDLFAILQTRFGAGTEEMSRTSSSIATMADETSATNAEIIQAALSMGRLASTVKMSEPEMIALAAATKQSGIEASEVGTQWGSLTRNLASHSEATQAAYAALGLKQSDYFKALQDSKNTGSNAPVLKFLAELDKRLQKSGNSAQQSMQLFGSYGAILGGSLQQVLSKYEELNTSSQKAYDENARLTVEYERMTGTMNSLLTAIGVKFNAIGVQMGTVLLGPLQDATYQLDQFLGKLMQGDMAGAWKGLYDALLNYNWVGAGMSIAGMVASGLSGIASFAAQAIAQLGVALLTHDWIGSGRSIAQQVLNGFNYVREGISGVLSGLSSWVSSGGATQAGQNLGNWIIDGIQSVFSAGVDLYSWLKTNLTVEKIGALVRDGLTGIKDLAKLGAQAGADFLGGIGTAITAHAGDIWGNLTKTAYDLVDDFTKVGQALVNALTSGIASGINSALNPVITKVNEILGGINQYSSKLGVTMPTFSPIALSGTNLGGVGTDYAKYYQEAKANYKQNTAQIFAGNTQVSGNESLMGAATKAMAVKDPYLFFKEAGAQGMSYNQTLAAFRQTGDSMTQNNSLNLGDAAKAWGEGMAGAKLMGGKDYGTGTEIAGETTPTEAVTAESVKKMADTWSGGVVPVEVQNWPDGFGAGKAAGGTAATSVNKYGQTVDSNGLPIGKFDASKINNTGPGIGMVKTEGGDTNASYANRLEIDTCEIDSFGMTPGLGKELAASGAWRPNAGAASQKLAAEIGYGGDYADPSQYGALMGGMNQVVKTQTNAATKTAGITVGAATKATGIQIGGTHQAVNTFASLTAAHTAKNAQTMDAASLNAKVSLEDGAYTCFNAIDGGAHTFSQEMALVTAEQKATSVAVRDNIQAGGQHVKENSLTSSLDFKNTVGSAGTDFKDKVNAGMASWSTALGSGLSSLSGIASYITGGAGWAVGGGVSSAGNGITQTPGGPGSFGGTSIGGGGSWVGTGASYSGAGAKAVSGGSFTSSNGVRWFADGGIVTKPGIVGVGEAGAEAIVPIGKLPEIMAQAIGGGSAGGAHTHAIYIDGKKVADAVGAAMVTRTRQGAGLKVR
jgi:TP901 family phage tail tape measure protein